MEKGEAEPYTNLVYLQREAEPKNMRVLILFKKRCVLLFLLFLFQVLIVHSQNPVVDSLRNIINNAKDDTSKVLLYYEYGRQFENTHPDTALHYYNMARERSAALNFLKGQTIYASHAIVILNNRGEFRKALDFCKEALILYKQSGSKKDLSIAHLNVGSEWQYLSDFQLAAENYLEAKKFAEEIHDKRLLRIANNNLASIFINLKEYQKGREYAEKSLAVAIEMRDDYAISSSTFNIATAELSLKQYDKALKHYRDIENIGIRTDDYIVILDGQLGIAEVYSAMLNIGQAEKYFKQVISFSQEKSSPEYEMYAYMGISDLYITIGRNKDAEQSVLKGIALALVLGSNFELKDLYLKASLLEEKNSKFSSALAFRKKYETLNDSIVGEKSKSNINLFEARFESEKKESMIRQLEADKELQRLELRQKDMVNFILIGSAVTMLVISLLYYRNYKHKQILQQHRISELETEKQLTATEAVLKGEEQEGTRMAKDLHDGLGGMLSGMKYSFNTMKGNIIMTPENQQAFERGMDMLDSSIMEMRRIAHNMMPESLVKFGLNTALRDYCIEINNSGALNINYQSIGLENENPDQIAAITIYRIVQELITNTLKHAAAERAVVQITKTGLHYSVTVEDDGKGFDLAMLQKSKGIGWANIQHRVDFLKGKLDVDSAAGRGTSVHIEFNV